MLFNIMSGEQESPYILQSTSQPQMYNFVPSAAPKEPVQRNYVFVDEHNRHKRLKVMRACEGCRRRKIKCDSATTNTWPCAACVRLKLQCVPPSVSYEKDSPTPGTHTFELTKSHSYPSSAPSVPDYQQQILEQQFGTIDSAIQDTMPASYGDIRSVPSGVYMQPTTSTELLQYGGVSASPVHHDPNSILYSHQGSVPPPPRSEQGWATDSHVSTLADAFGDLQIDLSAQAPYITDQLALQNSPPVQEDDVHLPSSIGPGRRIRIPPEMMPSEQIALQYFKYFFTTIHPFTPVLSQPAFYQQWASNRESMSPLLLAAVFACVTAMLDKTQEFNQWIAFASRHEESFKDVPRLSTVQALILLIKARESQPNRRGYFYRSWTSLVNIIAMAKDLGVHEHLSDHQDGGGCNSTPSDCVAKTRLWQLLFILEAMIGGPQGRLNFGVDPETVEFSQPKTPTIAGPEFHISREFTAFARNVANVRRTIKAYVKLHKKGLGWSMRDEYVAVEEGYQRWPKETPPDLQITVPNDDTPPFIPSAFLGGMNTYYQLSIIMHHRAQIHYLMEHVQGNSWKPYMLACLEAGRQVCRITEGILQSYGIEGIRAMQRGVSFTIYAMLTCSMLQLAAITAPDPDINTNARDFFVRCMRLLEQCTPYWPLQAIQIQINALREAFSADVSKPFDLKPGFPFGSPTPQPSEIPLVSPAAYSQAQENPLDATSRVSYTTTTMHHPMTPPVSITEEESKTDSPLPQSLGMLPDQSTTPQSAIQATTPQAQAQWNPSHLFNKWNSAFYTPAVARTTPDVVASPTLSNVPSVSDYDLNQQAAYAQSVYSSHEFSPEPSQLPMTPQSAGPTSYPGTGFGMEYVSPAAWQDVVANSFQTGGKRRWHDKNVNH